MKLLVIALSGIGDALMFTPALVKLREAMPNSQIDVLVMFKGVRDIYDKLPQVNNIHFFDFINSSKISSLFFVLSLRNKYDTTINVYPSNRLEYNLITRLIGAKKRVGVEYLREDKNNFGALVNIRIKENDSLHNVEENYAMVEYLLDEKYQKIPSLQFNIEGDDIEYATDFFREKSISEHDIVIGFHPGCNTLKNHDKRRWETEKFAGLANKLIELYNAKILIFGGVEENHLKEKIIAQSNSIKVTSVQTFNLSHTAAVMKRCNVFITNDSSLMHVAAAMKLNIVAIIGPTNKNYIYPWQTNYEIASLNLDCAPCFYYSPKPLTCSRTDTQFKCIKDLTIDLVLEKTMLLLNNK
jgi:heptosyltransferase II